MNILFICRHNIFRSRVAEEYLKKLNRNPRIKISSAGIMPNLKGECSSAEKKAVKEQGLKLNSSPRGINVSLLRNQEIIFVAAGDIPKGLLDNKSYIKKVIYWNIPDVLENNITKARKVVRLIIKNVDALNNKLEVKAPCP